MVHEKPIVSLFNSFWGYMLTLGLHLWLMRDFKKKEQIFHTATNTAIFLQCCFLLQKHDLVILGAKWEYKLLKLEVDFLFWGINQGTSQQSQVIYTG